MMPVQPGETLVAFAVGRSGVRVRIVDKGDGAGRVRALMARVDAAAPGARSAYVVGEFTSDGSRWPVGGGRTLASRWPRTLADGTYYSGWLVE